MQLSSMKEDLDNILDRKGLSRPSCKYVKSMMLSNSFIDAHELYEYMSGLIFESLAYHQYIESVGSKNSFIYIISAASGQYIVTDEFTSAKLVTYRLSNEFYMKVIEFSSKQLYVYITNWRSVIIFNLEYDERNKTFKVNNKNVIQSPLIKTLSAEETKEVLTMAYSQYILHVISNND